MEPDYIPSYFNTFYDVERDYYKGQHDTVMGQPTTKLQYLTDYADKGKNWTGGYYFDLVFDLTGIFSVGGSFEHNKLYNYNAKKYNNYQINAFLDMFLFDALSVDFLITLQALGEEGRELKNQPYFSGSITYYLNRYFSFGFRTASKWYLYNIKNDPGEYGYYMSFSIGAFAGISF